MLKINDNNLIRLKRLSWILILRKIFTTKRFQRFRFSYGIFFLKKVFEAKPVEVSFKKVLKAKAIAIVVSLKKCRKQKQNQK